MSCNEIRELLHAWLDRELDPARSLEIEEHLKRCPECLRDSKSFEFLRGIVASRAIHRIAPPALVHQVRAALRKAERSDTRPSAWFGNWLAELNWSRLFAPITAAGLVVLFVIFLLSRPSDEELWARDVVSAEVRSLMPDHLTDVASLDQHTVKLWFNGKLDYTPPVVDLAAKGFPLVGGRLDFLRDHRMAALVYKDGNHFINLFVWPTTDSNTPEKSLTRKGYHIVHWVQAGMDCWAVSDVKMGAVQEFAHLFRTAIEPEEPAP